MSAAQTAAGLAALRNANIARGVLTAHPITIARAEGASVWDVEGKEYLDFVAGIGVLNVGHNHPRVVAAVEKQLKNVTHMAFQVAAYRPYLDLAEKLNRLAGKGEAYKCIFLTSGAEAVENAVKIARAYTNRSAVIAFRGGFHGRTMLGVSLTGMSQPYKQNFGPFASEIFHTAFPDSYRDMTTERTLEALDEVFATEIAPDRVAAIIIEPVQGDGGFLPAPPPFLKALREITKRHDIVLIADEIQTGFGRTGKLFGFEHSGIQPDLVTVAKSLAGGFPLSGVVGRAEVMDAPFPVVSVAPTAATLLAASRRLRFWRPSNRTSCSIVRSVSARGSKQAFANSLGSTRSSATCEAWASCRLSSWSRTGRPRRRIPIARSASSTRPVSADFL